MNTIQITRLRDDPGETSLKIEVPRDTVERAERKAASRYAKQARIPGFRKGKVPADVVRRKFRSAIRESVLRDIISDSWKAALEQEDLKPIADPRIRDLKFEEDEDVTFELLVEVKPDINISRLDGFTVTRRTPEVTDAMVDEQLERLRKQRAPWTPVTEGRPQPGDLVAVHLTVFEEGESEAEGRDVQFVLGEDQAIPDIEEKVMGLTPGETYDGTVSFPEDFPDETKRGQSRGVLLKLHEVKRQDLPELNDDLAREVGDFESLEDLRAAIREDLESEAAREADAAVRRELVEQLVAANNIIAPRPMVQRMLQAYAQAYEVSEEQFEDFAREFAPMAEKQVQRELLVDKIIEEKKLAATEEELDERIEDIAKSRDTDPGAIYSSLQKNNRLKELERGITEKKVFDFLKEQNTVVEEKA